MGCGEHHLLVDLLAVMFGVGAWVSVNGIWVELPLLVQLPEGWALPSYLSVIIQIANIGPIAYSATKFLCPRTRAAPAIYLVLTIGCLSSLLLALFWDETTMIFGSTHSTALLVLVFFLALVDCTSSVLYLPYMAAWKNKYLPFYSMGEGMSGLLPALVALAQGVGKTDNSESGGEPNFSVTVFFFILFAMMVASALAFTCLDLFPPIQSEKTVNAPDLQIHDNDYTSSDDPSPITVQGNKDIPTLSSTLAKTPTQSNIIPNERSLNQDNRSHSSNSLLVDENGTFEWPKHIFFFLLAGQMFASLLTNGFLPAIQSYSCGPYGATAYHLVATLSAFANPCAALATALCRRATPWFIAVLLALGSLVGSYLIVTAAMSPFPPLVGTDVGSALVVVSWIMFTLLLSYVRVEINNLLRLTGGSRGGKVLFWSGASTQAGSFIGALTAFLLVNVAKVFKS